MPPFVLIYHRILLLQPKKCIDKNMCICIIVYNETTNQEFKLNDSAISIAGFNKDQKEAAIITPAENPSKQSIIFLFTFLKKKTTEAPNIVTNQVKIVAKSACITGDKHRKKSIIKSPI